MQNALMVGMVVLVSMVVLLAGAFGMPVEPAAIIAAMCGLAVFVPLAEAEREAELRAAIRQSQAEWADRLAADAERRDRAAREARLQEARDRAAEHERQMAELFGDLETVRDESDDLLNPPGKDVVVEADEDGVDTEFQPKPPLDTLFGGNDRNQCRRQN